MLKGIHKGRQYFDCLRTSCGPWKLNAIRSCRKQTPYFFIFGQAFLPYFVLGVTESGVLATILGPKEDYDTAIYLKLAHRTQA